MTSPHAETLEARCLRSLTFPDAIDGSSFDFSLARSTGTYAGKTSMHVALQGGRFTLVEGKGKPSAEGYFSYFRGDRRSAGGVTLYFDDERPSAGINFDFQSLRRGVYAGTFTLQAWAEGNHTPSTAGGTFSAAVMPGVGAVSGEVFDDHDADGVIDAYELGVRGATVWADLDDDGQYDRREPRAFTNSHGSYLLRGVPAAWQRTIRVQPRAPWEVLARSAAGRTIGVLSGQTVATINFSAGHDAWVSGAVFADTNGDGQVSPGDTGLPGSRVWADLDNDRRLDEDEPTAWASTGGRYILHGDVPAGTAVRVDTQGTVVLPGKRVYVFATSVARGTQANFLVRL